MDTEYIAALRRGLAETHDPEEILRLESLIAREEEEMAGTSPSSFALRSSAELEEGLALLPPWPDVDGAEPGETSNAGAL